MAIIILLLLIVVIIYSKTKNKNVTQEKDQESIQQYEEVDCWCEISNREYGVLQIDVYKGEKSDYSIFIYPDKKIWSLTFENGSRYIGGQYTNNINGEVANAIVLLPPDSSDDYFAIITHEYVAIPSEKLQYKIIGKNLGDLRAFMDQNPKINKHDKNIAIWQPYEDETKQCLALYQNDSLKFLLYLDQEKSSWILTNSNGKPCGGGNVGKEQINDESNLILVDIALNTTRFIINPRYVEKLTYEENEIYRITYSE